MNELHVSFPAVSQNEALARGVAAQFLRLSDPTLEELSDVRTAVSEAVTNAVVHAYGNRGGTVDMLLRMDDGVLTVAVSDKGRGIEDVEAARQPFFTTAPEDERSGLGFVVMEAFMDSVDVRSQPCMGTTVTMKKRLIKDG